MALTEAQQQALLAAPPEKRYRYVARRFAAKFKLDPDLFEAQIEQESGFNPTPPDSGQGALGIAQFLPSTAQAYNVTPDELIKEPVKALYAAANHMADLRDKYGDQQAAILAYHQGEPNVDAGTIGPKGREYLTLVQQRAEKLRGRKAGAPAAAPVAETAPAATTEEADIPLDEAPPAAPTAAEAVPSPSTAAGAPGAFTAGDTEPPPAVTPMGLVKQAGSGLVEGATNVVDLAGTVLSHLGGPNQISAPFAFPTAGDKVAAYLAAPPTTTAEKYTRATARGVGATVATGGTSLPAVALGAASGAGAQLGGDVTEQRLGTRVPGEIIGGLAPVAGVTAVRAWNSRAARLAAEADAVKQVEGKLSTQSPIERATTVRQVLGGNVRDIKEFNSSAWDQFLGQHGKLGVPLDDLKYVTAKDIVDEAVGAGLSRDAAVAKADKIMNLVRPNGQAVDVLPFEMAKELRSEIGTLTTRGGKAGFRAKQLYKQISQTMESVLPSDVARQDWANLNAMTTQEVELLRNTFVKRAINPLPQGQATADKYVVGLLENGFSPARQVEVRAVLKAGGDQLRPVLGDALLRHAIREHVRGTGETATIDWKGLAQSLRDPQRYRDLSMELLGAREQNTIIKLAETAGDADPRSVLNLVGKVALDLTGGAALHAVTGRAGVGEAWVGYRALASLRDPANRALLKRAAKTVADSIKGREILRALLARPGEVVTPSAAPVSQP